MPKPALPFKQTEYDDRLLMVRTAMAMAGLDGLLVTDPSNMAWLTGYDGWSFYVHQGVIVTQDAGPIWWGRDQDTKGAARTVWMQDNDIIGYADDYVQSDDVHPMEDLARHIDGLSVRNLGVEMDNYYFSAKAFSVLLQALPNVGFADATGMVNWQRAVKSDAELDLMRKAAAISNKIMDGLLARVEPGQPKNEVVGDVYRDALHGTQEAWGDYPAIVPLMPSGADAAAPHLTWNGDPFRAGEATSFEIAGCHRRYHAPLCRTLYLGDPPDAMQRAEAAVLEALDAGIDAARPGNRACDVANAVNTALARHGIERDARCGYPIGLSYPPDWGERTMSFRAKDESALEPNMTFHLMPGLWMDGWGLSITESIRITENGPADPLCAVPRQLFTKR